MGIEISSGLFYLAWFGEGAVVDVVTVVVEFRSGAAGMVWRMECQRGAAAGCEEENGGEGGTGDFHC